MTSRSHRRQRRASSAPSGRRTRGSRWYWAGTTSDSDVVLGQDECRAGPRERTGERLERIGMFDLDDVEPLVEQAGEGGLEGGIAAIDGGNRRPRSARAARSSRRGSPRAGAAARSPGRAGLQMARARGVRHILARQSSVIAWPRCASCVNRPSWRSLPPLVAGYGTYGSVHSTLSGRPSGAGRGRHSCRHAPVFKGEFVEAAIARGHHLGREGRRRVRPPRRRARGAGRHRRPAGRWRRPARSGRPSRTADRCRHA